MNNIKVVYISPNYEQEDISVDDIEQMTNSELLTFAKNSNYAQIFTLKQFQQAFNSELISDMGYIYFVEDEESYTTLQLKTF